MTLPTHAEIEAFRPALLRSTRWFPGDREDVVQEVLIWAHLERDSYNPARGSLAGWLYGMLRCVIRWRIDAWRAAGAVTMPRRLTYVGPPLEDLTIGFSRQAPSVRKPAARKYHWPPGLTLERVRAVAQPAEWRAFEARAHGEWSPYQNQRLSTLRRRLVLTAGPTGHK